MSSSWCRILLLWGCSSKCFWKPFHTCSVRVAVLLEYSSQNLSLCPPVLISDYIKPACILFCYPPTKSRQSQLFLPWQEKLPLFQRLYEGLSQDFWHLSCIEEKWNTFRQKTMWIKVYSVNDWEDIFLVCLDEYVCEKKTVYSIILLGLIYLIGAVSVFLFKVGHLIIFLRLMCSK